jgi:hypothetical protein
MSTGAVVPVLTSLRKPLRHAIHALEIAGSAMALLAMVVLGFRAMLRLELRWDTFTYHLPFAALHARLHVPYELPPLLQAYYQGFPPLPEFLQGLLWRLTGSINATGIVNYLALLLFLFFLVRYLSARFWIAAVLSLTAPLVLIHAASSYNDLFTNALLATTVTAVLSMILFDRWTDAKLLAWCLAGAVGAAWSKFTVLPIVLLVFACLFLAYGRNLRQPAMRKMSLWVAIALFLALVPCCKNWVLYRNPTWPYGFTALKSQFPSKLDTHSVGTEQSPPPLRGASQPELFFRSLFEIDHPTSYPNRERWIIDQGNAWLAFRSGGFWAVSVVTTTFATVLLGFLSRLRHGIVVAVAIAIFWGLLAISPQSHELRYYLFLPLTNAALIAIFIPRVIRCYPATVLVLLVIIVGEFIWVSKINRNYYRVEHVGLAEAAQLYNVKRFWSQLQPDKTYCAVGFDPATFLLTGPTLHEYSIIDRDSVSECPPNTILLQK